MARLRHTKTGTVVDVSDTTAGRLGPGWVPVDEPKKPARRRTKKPADADSTESGAE